MAIYNSVQTFGPYPERHPDAIIMVKVGTGNLTIVAIMEDGSELPVVDGLVIADAAFSMVVANGKFKATPTGTCVFEWRD